MIDRAHDLPIIRQAEALRVSRSSVYYLPRSVPATSPSCEGSTGCIWSIPSQGRKRPIFLAKDPPIAR